LIDTYDLVLPQPEKKVPIPPLRQSVGKIGTRVQSTTSYVVDSGIASEKGESKPPATANRLSFPLAESGLRSPAGKELSAYQSITGQNALVTLSICRVLLDVRLLQWNLRHRPPAVCPS